MDSHSLIKVAYMLLKVRSTNVDGERWLMEPPRKYCPFNLAREGRLGNLVQCLAHSVISQTFVRRALVSMFVMVFFIIGKGLAGWSSWPSLITSILFTLWGNVRVGGGFVLTVHGATSSLIGQSLIAWLCYVALERRDFQLESDFQLHATLLISPPFKIKEIILSLGPRRFLLMGSWSYHSWPLHSLAHEFSPQTTPIVRTGFGPWPEV